MFVCNHVKNTSESQSQSKELRDYKKSKNENLSCLCVDWNVNPQHTKNIQLENWKGTK